MVFVVNIILENVDVVLVGVVNFILEFFFVGGDVSGFLDIGLNVVFVGSIKIKLFVEDKLEVFFVLIL